MQNEREEIYFDDDLSDIKSTWNTDDFIYGIWVYKRFGAISTVFR